MQLPGFVGHPFIFLNEPCRGLHGGIDDQSNTVRFEFSAFGFSICKNINDNRDGRHEYDIRMSQIGWLFLPAVLVKDRTLLAMRSRVAHAVRQSMLTVTKQWETDV